MKLLVVPDIHQRVSKAEMALSQWEKEVDAVIFLGDYFDGKDDHQDARTTVDWLMDSLSRDNRIHLLGNHDLSYRWPKECKCSGHRESTQSIVDDNMSEGDWLRFQYAVFHEGWLISHAGFHPSLIEPDRDSQRNIDRMLSLATELQASPDPSSELLQAGFARGGEQEVGGVIWLDWNYEFEPLPGVNQLIGHTSDPFYVRRMNISNTGEIRRHSFAIDEIEAGSTPEAQSVNWCIDCGLNVFAIVEDAHIDIRVL